MPSDEVIACGFRLCRRRFRRERQPGRPRLYCSDQCGRQERQLRESRDAPAKVAEPARLGLAASQTLLVRIGALAEAESRKAGLQELLGRAADVRAEVDRYVEAAVTDVRSEGAGWHEVAVAAQVSVRTAQARWGRPAMEPERRRPEHQVVLPAAFGSEGVAIGHLLAGAVSFLPVDGERVPRWLAVCTLVTTVPDCEAVTALTRAVSGDGFVPDRETSYVMERQAEGDSEPGRPSPKGVQHTILVTCSALRVRGDAHADKLH
ncbi:hypothetical protein [Streptomyces sp. NPDC046985]|uniref:hypothetical protein n=1 Tax=Streptomyces sp. NPDC046985 TaxID=3155377 RepID=UPI0033D30FA6